MTEAEWLECTEPQPMLDFLRGKASDRKLRLFAVACSRRVWHLLDGTCRKAVEAAEISIDEGLSDIELAELKQALESAKRQDGDHSLTMAYYGVRYVLGSLAPYHPMMCCRYATPGFAAVSAWASCSNDRSTDELRQIWDLTRSSEQMAQSVLLREIFGVLHFRPRTLESPPSRAPVALAQAIYDERAFDRLPILADALEDAGCTNQDILSHCRGGGEHCRGCWPLDLLLGKE